MTSTLLDLPMRLFRGQRGFVFVLFALALVMLLALSGLAIDTARGYVNKAEVSKAVDAAALAGAKNVRAGTTEAEDVARAISSANGIEPDADELLSVTITPSDEGETDVFVEARRRVPTTFMRVLGWEEMNVVSVAQATVPPIDLVLVLDQSGSMVRNDAWDDLQKAAKRFVERFDDDIDQVGVVHFSTMAAVALPMQKSFTSKAAAKIDAMDPKVFCGVPPKDVKKNCMGDTNSEEGLTFGMREVTSPAAREKSIKVVVFFTDGRPTGFRHEDGKDIGGADGILTVSTKTSDGNKVLGWYSAPEDDPKTLDPAGPARTAKKCYWVDSCITGGRTWKRNDVSKAAKDEAVTAAQEIRRGGIFLYTIGLGNKKAKDPEETPDEKFLEGLSNVKGKGVSDETVGGYFFAGKPEDLDAVFQAVAADILARLSQ